MQRTGRRRTTDGLLIALGAALTLVILLVLQSFLGSGLLSTRTMMVTVTTSDVYEQTAIAYEAHLSQLDARNIPAITSGYESNATIEWTGVAEGMTGNYSGSANIKILMGSFLGKFVNFSLSNEYQSLGVAGNVSVVNSTFNFRGYNAVVGIVSGTIVAQDVYQHTGGSSWLIARETWNFTQFNEQFPMT